MTGGREIRGGLTYPWRRFWIPRGGSVRLHAGYLADPEERKFFNPEVVTWEEASVSRCLVLLGEPGMGKSRAIEQAGLNMEAPNRLFLNLRGYSDQKLLNDELFDSPKFIAWLASAGELELILDSLDECLIHIKTVASWLLDRLKRCPISRLKLRIACRTAEWPAILDEELPNIWSGSVFGAFELAPLRRRDVRIAAQEEGLDVKVFESAVEKTGVETLASNPITLKFLISEFRQNHGLPHSPIELFEKGCRRLCTETSRSRISAGIEHKFTERQLVSVAERIAALNMFSGLSDIYTGKGDARPEEITVDLISGEPDVIDGKVTPVLRELIEEVLETSLFSGRSVERLGFAHWTYAEFLAARFCNTRSLTAEQVSDLIFHPDSGERKQVIPQLAECASWLAAMRPEVLKTIASNDPQVLMRSSVIGMDTESRLSVARSLLELFDLGKLYDHEAGFRTRYDVLAHPKLPELLEPYIRDKTKGVVVRRVAIDIAEACNVQSLSTILADIALDSDEGSMVRDQAAYAVARIGDAPNRERLERLLYCSEVEDPWDQLKGSALRALWPRHISIDDVLSSLTPARRKNFAGAYGMFVRYELPDTLLPQHLPAGLRWIEERSDEIEEWRDAGRLVATILRLAWEHFYDGENATRFAAIAIRRLEKYLPVLPKDAANPADDFLEADPKKRRDLFRRIVEHLALEQSGRSRLHLTELIHASDFQWLIQQFMEARGDRERDIWLELSSYTFRTDPIRHLSDLLVACKSDARLVDEFADWIQPVTLGSPRANRMRREYEDASRYSRPQNPTPTATHPPMSEIVGTWLDRFEAGHTDAWWKLNLDLTLAPESDNYILDHELDSDITALPGWKEIDDDLRLRCIVVAARYLRAADPHTDQWIGTNTFHRPAVAGYRALRLLYETSSPLIEGLSQDDWNRWAPVTVAFTGFSTPADGSPQHKLVALAYKNAPEYVIHALMKIIDKEKTHNGHLFVLRLAEYCWNALLIDALIEKIRSDETLPARSVADIISEVSKHSLAVIAPALELVAGRSASAESQSKAIAVAIELLNRRPAEVWSELWPILSADDAFGTEVIKGLAAHHEQSHGTAIASALPADEVADLYIWMCIHFPGSKDVDRDGMHFMTPEALVQEFRSGLISSLQELGTREATAAIRRVAATFKDEWWLSYAAIASERAWLRRTWTKIIPQTLLSMSTNHYARSIETSKQLAEAVIDSLWRLETRLHGETPAVVDLWDKDVPKDEMAVSDYIKRHLESDLNSLGVLAFREPEMRRGQETDIYAAALLRHPISGHSERIDLVIEVKGCWNPGLKQAMGSQLKGRYLHDRGGEGLYLVVWFSCERWADEDRKERTPDWPVTKAREFFSEQAAKLSSAKIHLHSFVLDAGRRT